ncbi:hypothetical protein YC2023_068685 [Brassica napus]
MMLMGDEYGHTRYGNNNSYGHDTALNNFHWKEATRRKEGEPFQVLFRVDQVPQQSSEPLFSCLHSVITWHENYWDNPESKFLAFT